MVVLGTVTQEFPPSVKDRMALPLPVPEGTEEHMLRLVADQACAATGCVAAGVTVVRSEGPALLVGSSLLGIQLEEAQSAAGHGPGLDAIGQLQVFNVACLATARSWPTFAPQAVARGIRSCLAVPIIMRGRALGALDLYADKPGAFEGIEQVGLHFAREAALALTETEGAHQRPLHRPAPRPEGRSRSHAAS